MASLISPPSAVCWPGCRLWVSRLWRCAGSWTQASAASAVVKWEQVQLLLAAEDGGVLGAIRWLDDRGHNWIDFDNWVAKGGKRKRPVRRIGWRERYGELGWGTQPEHLPGQRILGPRMQGRERAPAPGDQRDEVERGAPKPHELDRKPAPPRPRQRQQQLGQAGQLPPSAESTRR
jgi:hypothetical protein